MTEEEIARWNEGKMTEEEMTEKIHEIYEEGVEKCMKQEGLDYETACEKVSEFMHQYMTARTKPN